MLEWFESCSKWRVPRRCKKEVIVEVRFSQAQCCLLQACVIFFDEVDAVGGARFDDGAGGDNEVQRTMLELINQLDGFDPRGNIKVFGVVHSPRSC